MKNPILSKIAAATPSIPSGSTSGTVDNSGKAISSTTESSSSKSNKGYGDGSYKAKADRRKFRGDLSPNFLKPNSGQVQASTKQPTAPPPFFRG